MEPFIGQIQAFGFNFAPRGWAKCDGQLLSISSNTALFSLLGTTYGGDGRTTFALPDLRGRAPIHQGNGPGLASVALGARAGVENITLDITNLPSHTHVTSIKASSANASQSAPTAGSSIAKPGKVSGRSFNETEGFNTATPDVELSGESVIVGNTGGQQPFNNRNPYLGINYCIALVGLFPSRS